MAESSEHRVDDPAAVLAARGEEDDEGGEVSMGGSSFSDPQTAFGGADGVPDTPDGVAEDNIGDSEQQDFRRRGRDADHDRYDGSTTYGGSEVSPDSERPEPKR
ncbi:hypothetical protein FHX74_000158 [Friedmanniella endophytica]|uniref:Uncharacterized protein n=1 Tax=Microlunatus kandeliicorticis TaxID=1759536 RepID=A0A7W3INY4_9ACTN|nr:hypothetical protein [Microlunatus kandeliicorticis]MBA8792564.1 hypothetical protein [Microlunatus kandeliicorticis]